MEDTIPGSGADDERDARAVRYVYSLSENRLGEGDSPILLRELRKIRDSPRRFSNRHLFDPFCRKFDAALRQLQRIAVALVIELESDRGFDDFIEPFGFRAGVDLNGWLIGKSDHQLGVLDADRGDKPRQKLVAACQFAMASRGTSTGFSNFRGSTLAPAIIRRMSSASVSTSPTAVLVSRTTLEREARLTNSAEW